MLQILVDTPVWWHWFTFKQNPNDPNEFWEHSENFEVIYQIASSSTHVELFFNALIKLELDKKYSSDFDYYVLPIAKKIPIPQSHYDGRYHRYDGSILYGGIMGGLLKPFFTENATKLNPGERKQEKDVEHMESALEAGADLFITNDKKTILKPLEHMQKNCYDSSHPINQIFAITKTPTDSLPDVKEYINA